MTRTRSFIFLAIAASLFVLFAVLSPKMTIAQEGLHVGTVTDDGVDIEDAGGLGVHIGSAIGAGVGVDNAGGNGFSVGNERSYRKTIA